MFKELKKSYNEMRDEFANNYSNADKNFKEIVSKSDILCINSKNFFLFQKAQEYSYGVRGYWLSLSSGQPNCIKVANLFAKSVHSHTGQDVPNKLSKDDEEYYQSLCEDYIFRRENCNF